MDGCGINPDLKNQKIVYVCFIKTFIFARKTFFIKVIVYFTTVSNFRDYSPDNFDDMEKHFTSVGAFDWIKGNYKVLLYL